MACEFVTLAEMGLNPTRHPMEMKLDLTYEVKGEKLVLCRSCNRETLCIDLGVNAWICDSCLGSLGENIAKHIDKEINVEEVREEIKKNTK